MKSNKQRMSKEIRDTVKMMSKSQDIEVLNLGTEMFWGANGSYNDVKVVNPDVSKGMWRFMRMARKMGIENSEMPIYKVKLTAAINRLKGLTWNRRKTVKWKKN